MAQKQALKTSCTCGAVQLELHPAGSAAATRLRCYCVDCQTAARYLGVALPAHGGTDLVQTTPDRLGILKGQDRLAILRLSPNGLCRWYATCCKTPLFNTLPRAGLPFLGLVISTDQAARADLAVGPVWGHSFTKYAPRGGGAPLKDVHFAGLGMGVVTRMLGAYLGGRARLNPLLDDTGDWIVTPHVLTRQERADHTPR